MVVSERILQVLLPTVQLPPALVDGPGETKRFLVACVTIAVVKIRPLLEELERMVEPLVGGQVNILVDTKRLQLDELETQLFADPLLPGGS